MKPVVLAAFASILLAGCAASGPTRISHSTIDPGYRLNEVAVAGSTGSVRTIITGDPFGVGHERFESAVTGAMYGHHFGPPMEFVTDPDADVHRSYRVVMMFDAPLTAGGRAVCQDAPDAAKATATPAPAPEQPIYVVAAFCRWDKPLTSLAGVVARTGVDDPQFRRFVQQATLRLFPASNPEAHPDREPEFPTP